MLRIPLNTLAAWPPGNRPTSWAPPSELLAHVQRVPSTLRSGRRQAGVTGAWRPTFAGASSAKWAFDPCIIYFIIEQTGGNSTRQAFMSLTFAEKPVPLDKAAGNVLSQRKLNREAGSIHSKLNSYR